MDKIKFTGTNIAAAVLVLPLIDDADVLSSLIDALEESHDPRALPALEGLLENAGREIHLHAISAMGELGVASAAGRTCCARR